MPALVELEPEDLPLTGYRKSQLAHALYVRGVRELSEVTDLPAETRDELARTYRLHAIESARVFASQDGSVKYLFSLADGAATEAVYMPYQNRRTVCLSSMVGCSAGCVFCASGSLGFGRNLSAGEIIDQLLWIASDQGLRPGEIQNVVLMGMGEPLLNWREVHSALKRFTSQTGLAFSPRRLTLSTVGIPKGIRSLAQTAIPVRLALSLHGPDDATRAAIIPTARRFSITEILAAVQEYQTATGRRVSLEYTLLQDLNDSPTQARALARIARELGAHVNLIPFNSWSGAPVTGTSKTGIMAFAQVLESARVRTSVRWSRGQDVGAACGQLALQVPS